MLVPVYLLMLGTLIGFAAMVIGALGVTREKIWLTRRLVLNGRRAVVASFVCEFAGLGLIGFVVYMAGRLPG